MATHDKRPPRPRREATTPALGAPRRIAARAVYSWHVWLDDGEAWARETPPPVQTTVTTYTATEAAVEAYNRLRHLTKGDEAKFIVKCVDDPAVGTEKPFWLVTVAPRPVVVDISATTLGNLCDEPTKPGAQS